MSVQKCGVQQKPPPRLLVVLAQQLPRGLRIRPVILPHGWHYLNQCNCSKESIHYKLMARSNSLRVQRRWPAFMAAKLTRFLAEVLKVSFINIPRLSVDTTSTHCCL